MTINFIKTQLFLPKFHRRYRLGPNMPKQMLYLLLLHCIVVVFFKMAPTTAILDARIEQFASLILLQLILFQLVKPFRNNHKCKDFPIICWWNHRNKTDTRLLWKNCQIRYLTQVILSIYNSLLALLPYIKLDLNWSSHQVDVRTDTGRVFSTVIKWNFLVFICFSYLTTKFLSLIP